MYNIHNHNNTDTVIICTDISIQKRYKTHKHINTNAYIVQVLFQNKYFTGNIYNKIPKKRQTQGKYFVKYANISNITYI